MATRSIVALAEGDGWRGVYHHYDGYPSGLGRALYRTLRRLTDSDIAALYGTILSHTAGWSTLLVRIRDDYEVVPAECQCYCHWAGRRELNDNMRYAQQDRGWREEYLYVYAPATRTLYIYDTHTDHDLLLGAVPIDGPEPDWDEITHERSDEVRAFYDQRFGRSAAVA